MTEVLGRSARKRQTILSAGRELFLSNGYQGTSVDQIAASAEVSKQTVYKHFGDKQELLLAIVNNALESTVAPFLDRIAALADTMDLEADLTALAADYLSAVLQEPVVQLRRLVVGEANGSPSWRGCTTNRLPPARWPRSPNVSIDFTTAGCCRYPNPLLPQSISRSSSLAGASIRRCSAADRKFWPASTPNTMSAPACTCFSQVIGLAPRPIDDRLAAWTPWSACSTVCEREALSCCG